MRLATVRTASGLRAVRIEGARAIELDAPDVGALLQGPEWSARARQADGPTHDADALDFAPLVPRPDKIVCVGLNYRSHIVETGAETPTHPTLFAKYASALVGARDDIVLPTVSTQVDWEAELAVVVGAPARDVDADAARSAIAGYSVLNDVSMRDWQHRTSEWLQGKTFESSTPLGPVLVTADDLDATALDVVCEVDGEQVQHGNTADLVFDPATLIAYISAIFTLVPGDVIATGTPAGVGHARTPARYLEDGAVVVTRITGIGELRNRCRRAVVGA